MKLGYLFSLYEVLSSTCSLSGNCSKRSVQRKRRKCLHWFLSACAFQDKQPIDCMTFLNTSIYGAYAGRISFQPTYSCRVGGGYFLQPLSRGWCKWESIVSGLVQNWIFKLIQLFFIFIFSSSSSSSHVPLRFVTSHPVRVTRIRQSSKKANFILERKKPLFKRVKLIWSINIEVNKQIKTGIFARYPGLLKAFYIDFLCFSQIVASFTLLLKEIL